MTTYKSIIGKDINSLTTDPDNAQAEGQIWYNSTSGVFKDLIVGAAWSSGANLITAREQNAGGGTQDAAFTCGGTPPGSPASALTEEYNGAGWAAGGALGTGRRLHGAAGTQTAGLAFAGLISSGTYTTTSEEYDGSSWTGGNSMNTERRDLAGFGIQTAGVAVGGRTPPNANTGATEEYNGSSWTSSPGSLNTASHNLAAAGILTAGIVFGGSPDLDMTEEYDGSTWTTVNNMNTGRQLLTGSGIQTSALAASGTSDGTLSPSVGIVSEEYDGTDWTNTTSMTTARFNASGLQGTGTSNAGLVAGGYTTTAVGTTEEYNKSVNTITAAAWASGGNLNTARYSLGGFGTATAGVAMCGRDSPIYQATEEYDGSSWTTVNNYPQTVVDLGSTGVLTAGLGLGGLDPPSIPSFPTTGRVTGEYDGTNWTTGGSYTYDAWGTGCAGTQTATVASGGHNYPMPPGNISSSAEYDGSSWTAGNSMSQARALFASSGSQTAAVVTGGRSSPGVEDPTNKTEEYDGTNWTSGGNYLISVKENTQGGGPQTAAYMAGGSAPPYTTVAGHYDGTAWATAASLPTVKGLGNAASNTADNTTGLVFGGAGPSTTNTTFDFTAETSAVNAKTLTTS